MVGDLLAMVVALWFTLGLRYSTLPDYELFARHLELFLPIFILWIIGCFIFNLYGKFTLARERDLPLTIIRAQLFNGLLAAVIFYLLPQSGVTPKTILFFECIFAVAFLLLWRVFLFPLVHTKRRETALVLGSTPEVNAIAHELQENTRSGFAVLRLGVLPTQESFERSIGTAHASVVIFDIFAPAQKELLARVAAEKIARLKLYHTHALYEELFDRVPLSHVNDYWFLENIPSISSGRYDLLKRVMDLVIGMVVGLVTLVLTPFVACAIFLEDRGAVFIWQERVGYKNESMYVPKFRTMRGNDAGAWGKQGMDTRVTRVGRVLRATRIDELPQVWNVLKGELSFVGPRPDIINLGKQLAAEIPYYTYRNSILPGLTGWAQINQDIPPRSVEETRERLAYDFYYLKHRSFWLDVKIALRTVKTLLSRSGL